MVVPFIFPLADLGIDASLSQILFDQLAISNFRVQKCFLLRWRCEAKLTITYTVFFFDFLRTTLASESHDARQEYGFFHECVLILI